MSQNNHKVKTYRRYTEDKEKGIKKYHYKKMAIVSPRLSIITLNVNGLNFPIKTHRVTTWIQKTRKTKTKTQLYAVYQRCTSALRAHITESEGMEKRYLMQMEIKRKQA